MWDIAEILAEYCVVKCEIFARKGWDIGEKLIKQAGAGAVPSSC